MPCTTLKCSPRNTDRSFLTFRATAELAGLAVSPRLQRRLLAVIWGEFLPLGWSEGCPRVTPSGHSGHSSNWLQREEEHLLVPLSQPSALEPTEPARLVLVSAHRKLLDEIVDSLMQGTQFLALTGAPRVGKTTMAAAIHEELNKRSVPVRRVDGCRGTGIHLQTIMSQVLGKSEADVDADDVERLFCAMTERETPNEKLALIIDDAERLLPDALAYLRLLVSIAPEHMPQIIFIGDPSFWDIADQVTEAGFKDLIAAHFVLELLNPTEMFEATEQFISALCHVPRPVLDQGALEAVVQRSNGLVGSLVSLVAAIDALATESDQTQVTAAVVDAAAARLEGEAASPVTDEFGAVA